MVLIPIGRLFQNITPATNNEELKCQLDLFGIIMFKVRDDRANFNLLNRYAGLRLRIKEYIKTTTLYIEGHKATAN